MVTLGKRIKGQGSRVGALRCSLRFQFSTPGGFPTPQTGGAEWGSFFHDLLSSWSYERVLRGSVDVGQSATHHENTGQKIKNKGVIHPSNEPEGSMSRWNGPPRPFTLAHTFDLV